MHTFASTLASFFMASSQIPHAMEQTLVTPFGAPQTTRMHMLSARRHGSSLA